jgi:predicted dehydrogenase
MPSKAPLALGVLGCANIARQFLRDVTGVPSVRIAAIASRDAAKAAEFATTFAIPRHYGSYEALLGDPEIEAVYLPLPNSLHARWGIRAAEAGKHVLCEKPLALDRAEAEAMFATARRHGVLLLEAYPYYFQPQTRDMLRLLEQGAIGEVRSVVAAFGFTLLNPEGNIRMQKALGGGALLDAGSYAMSLIRLVMGGAPERVVADSVFAGSGVDIATMATLRFANGRRAQLSCAMNAANHRRAVIAGSQGTIETEFLNHTANAPGDNPHGYLPSQMRLRRGIANSVPFEDIRSSPVGSGFRFAAESFARIVREKDTAEIERMAKVSLDIAATLDAIAASVRTGAAVAVGETLPAHAT